jgi:uncharacterized membrane protein YhaH (DUF805 family)
VWSFLFGVKGRVSRKGIWLGLILPQFAVFAVATGIDMGVGWYNRESDIGILSGLASLFYLWPNIAVTVKRFHDRNMTGWWIFYFVGIMLGALVLGIGGAALFKGLENPVLLFLFFTPVLAVVIIQTVILYFLPGAPGENLYGPDPREAA